MPGGCCCGEELPEEAWERGRGKRAGESGPRSESGLSSQSMGIAAASARFCAATSARLGEGRVQGAAEDDACAVGGLAIQGEGAGVAVRVAWWLERGQAECWVLPPRLGKRGCQCANAVTPLVV